MFLRPTTGEIISHWRGRILQNTQQRFNHQSSFDRVRLGGYTVCLSWGLRSWSKSIRFHCLDVCDEFTCQIISQQCNLTAISYVVRYRCSDLFEGDLENGLRNTTSSGGNAGTVVRIEQFNDPELTIGQPALYPGGANPMYAVCQRRWGNIISQRNGRELQCTTSIERFRQFPGKRPEWNCIHHAMYCYFIRCRVYLDQRLLQ